ncbi:hypothetical protein BU23DRAFT_631202 [Bimuria novae-zelandiae CBS 107.79]|uniref:Uncharacterized protein n=1 Tax=Bimuria novae-zelandiae CBS 107.79 TaxID=1447943 RepID=A0A6A5VFL2_9PLEO|nr:hypothetical protein BU23DRAFT_631202 [Bimuria novae-zelandiae CBS 107.79]
MAEDAAAPYLLTSTYTPTLQRIWPTACSILPTTAISTYLCTFVASLPLGRAATPRIIAVMRLINCASLKFEEFIGSKISSYLILSHTWETYEISYKDYCGIDDLRLKAGPQVEKILRTCDVATRKGYRYAWIDTCCIDKSSSAELTKAINSMFKYDPGADFACCRWFNRGWTLQELIAPRDGHFYDAKWRHCGRKRELASIIAQITGISSTLISRGRYKPNNYPVAERMSWAAHRQTTREEDLAYCLFGIFNVNLSLLYGEGPKAFMRLQEDIVKNTMDLCLFAWQEQSNKKPQTRTSGLRGIFARSPSETTPNSRLQIAAYTFRRA